MPYTIKKVPGGFKVCKANDKTKCFSKKPLTKETAKKQMKAIIMSELNKYGRFTGKGSDYASIKKYV